ncbi:hypothetical protein BKA66DRAFT_564982 [Pyrenochaeta sp. MPI-SDFR-AT-0127]|nr:hypothetical protein BKA66DRAFT_564982 [Pyrenochaeta sp. MPI-SDFR-AT-0127]
MTPPAKSIRAPKSNIMSFDPAAMLTLRVGKTGVAKNFVTHASFLTSRSEFFRRAMNGKWAESKSRIIDFPDDDPGTFSLYLNYVYTGKLSTMVLVQEELEALGLKPFKKYVQDEYQCLSCIYVLAEKLQDIRAKDAVLAAMLDMTELRSAGNEWTVPNWHAIQTIYNGTPQFRHIYDCVGYLHQQKDFMGDLIASLDRIRPTPPNMNNIAKNNGIAAYLEARKEAK